MIERSRVHVLHDNVDVAISEENSLLLDDTMWHTVCNLLQVGIRHLLHAVFFVH